MKYHISTFGCQMNEADSQRLASELEKLGLSAAESREDADVLVLNTCVVRQSAEDKAYSYIQTLKPLKWRNPDVVIGVMGCLVGVRGNSPMPEGVSIRGRLYGTQRPAPDGGPAIAARREAPGPHWKPSHALSCRTPVCHSCCRQVNAARA